MYGYCVGVIGIEPDYFLDNMSQDEIGAIMKAKSEMDKTTWEQTRLICFYSTKGFKKPADLFIFNWEKKVAEIKKQSKEEFQARVEKLNKNTDGKKRGISRGKD